MNLKYSSKSFTILLLAVFLAASVSSAFGYAWCFGDNGHVALNYSTADRCCADDQGSNSLPGFDVSAISQRNADKCGSCLDFTSQQYEAVFSKRVKRASIDTTAPLISTVLYANSSDRFQKIVVNPAFQPELRISKALLAQRTIVLLH